MGKGTGFYNTPEMKAGFERVVLVYILSLRFDCGCSMSETLEEVRSDALIGYMCLLLIACIYRTI